MKVKIEDIKIPVPEVTVAKKIIKKRDNEYRKKRQEERALRYVQEQHPDINPTYKKGFNHICGNSVGRKYTVSIALPGSILEYSLSFEAKNFVIGAISRVAAIFSVDEIVIYDEKCSLPEIEKPDGTKEIDQSSCIDTLLTTEGDYDNNVLMAFILKYLETPYCLRKLLFPQHDCLSRASLLPPLAIPSHQRNSDHFPYREGLIVPVNEDDESVTKSNLMEIGLDEPIKIDTEEDINTRFTVHRVWKLQDKETDKWEIVNRDEPRITRGAYWGYRIRIANGISGVLNTCSKFNDACNKDIKDQNENNCKYDLVIGTSELGSNVDKYDMPKFKHLLIVFGGVQGIEYAIESDPNFKEDTKARSVFPTYLNTCPVQGSRTIKTEESMMISMSVLRERICKRGKN